MVLMRDRVFDLVISVDGLLIPLAMVAIGLRVPVRISSHLTRRKLYILAFHSIRLSKTFHANGIDTVYWYSCLMSTLIKHLYRVILYRIIINY